MKKFIALSVLAAIPAFVQAQGTIAVYSVTPTYAVYTNTTISAFNPGGQQTLFASGVSGKAGLPSSGFNYDYALLVTAYNSSLTGTPTISELQSLSVGVAGITNTLSAGGLGGPGHGSGAPTLGSTWGAPNVTYTDGTEDSYVLVGWSSSLGSSWSTVEAELVANNWSAYGYFGETSFGYGYSGGGANSLPAPNIFAVSTAEPGGLTAGPTLYAVAPVPEPTTLALSALGGLSLLAFRRKKA